MIVGAIGYQCHSGLGHLMRDFYSNGAVDRVLVVPHPHYQNYRNWYPREKQYNREKHRIFLNSMDVLLLFENAFWWDVVKVARSKRVKVVLIPNYEYTPYPIPVRPDLVLCASKLDVDYYCRDYRTEFLPIPVDTKMYPWRLRERATTFVHNAGHGQRGWAKGTPQIIEAARLLRTDARIVIRMQPGELRTKRLRDEWPKGVRNLELRYGEFNHDELYSEGDVFLNAEQYNGMSLMLQEAFASGMPCMTTDRYPTNTWLPGDMLIPVKGYERDRIAVEFDRAIVTPEAIAGRIDEWYGRDVTELSLRGKEWAEQHSWEVLGPKLRGILGSLL